MCKVIRLKRISDENREWTRLHIGILMTEVIHKLRTQLEIEEILLEQHQHTHNFLELITIEFLVETTDEKKRIGEFMTISRLFCIWELQTHLDINISLTFNHQ